MTYEPKNRPHFDGETYEPDLDHSRLTKQIDRVRAAMLDGQWRTLPQISEITSDPEASISARLRDLRKTKFGGLFVERRRKGQGKNGFFEYRVLPNDPYAETDEPVLL